MSGSSASAAFASADFGDAAGVLDLWTDPPFHVGALHSDLSDRIAAEFFARTRTSEANPFGAALSGPTGSGKTHLLGELRRRVWDGGGWVIGIDIAGSGVFWKIFAAEFAASLRRRMSTGRTQAGAILLALLAKLGANAGARGALAVTSQVGSERGSALDLLLNMLAAVEPAETRRRQDVVRALALCDSRNEAISLFATAWLQGDAGEESRRKELGFLAPPPAAAEIVSGLLWIMSLSGPTLLAIDGVDALVAGSSPQSEAPDLPTLKALASGLLALHDIKRRAMTVIACREACSEAFFAKTALSAAFRQARVPPFVGNVALVERLVASRLSSAYLKAGFSPPYPTFPFTRTAIASAVGLSPRELLKRCRERQEACIAEGGIREWASFVEASAAPPLPPPKEFAPPPERKAPRQREILIGRSAQIGEVVGPVTLPLELLPRHVAVLAGGGKGVLLSRLVQEAVMAEIPALVLDATGDLARLGVPWPSRPTEFSEEDARKAKVYFERVDARLWSPALSRDAPMPLSVLPDFAALGQSSETDSAEARELAIEMAVATLEPYFPARGPGAIKLRGALVDAFRVFARAGGGPLDEFVRLLADLPQHASRQADAPKHTRDIANQLSVALATDPLLRQSDRQIDPARLFNGAPGKTRVSVIHLGGLGEEMRSVFVHRLQMALFAWIANHPSPSGRLLILDEAHLFAPSKETTVAKRSAFALAKQATKSGLGLIFASQSPRALDPGIVAGCLTHLYGAFTSPSDAAAVGALLTARGAPAEDPARLKPEEFHFSSEGHWRPIKLRAPPSLSRRTLSPPNAQEIEAIARRNIS